MIITDDVCLLDSAWGNNSYLIQGKNAILIDTGPRIRGKFILHHIVSLNIRLKHILLTHYDVDTMGNAAQLQNHTGAQVWASDQDIPYIQGSKDRHGLKKYLKYITRTSISIDIQPLPTSIDGIKVLLTPGHTPGHVCFLYRDILFVGDLLENRKGILRPPRTNWNKEILAQSLEKVADCSFKWICPAHGRPINFTPPRQPELKITTPWPMP